MQTSDTELASNTDKVSARPVAAVVEAAAAAAVVVDGVAAVVADAADVVGGTLPLSSLQNKLQIG